MNYSPERAIGKLIAVFLLFQDQDRLAAIKHDILISWVLKSWVRHKTACDNNSQHCKKLPRQTHQSKSAKYALFIPFLGLFQKQILFQLCLQTSKQTQYEKLTCVIFNCVGFFECGVLRPTHSGALNRVIKHTHFVYDHERQMSFMSIHGLIQTSNAIDFLSGSTRGTPVHIIRTAMCVLSCQ